MVDKCLFKHEICDAILSARLNDDTRQMQPIRCSECDELHIPASAIYVRQLLLIPHIRQIIFKLLLSSFLLNLSV